MTVDKVQLAEGVVRAREALDDGLRAGRRWPRADRKSTRLNSSHDQISYAVFCLKKKHKPSPYAAGTARPGGHRLRFLFRWHPPVASLQRAPPVRCLCNLYPR